MWDRYSRFLRTSPEIRIEWTDPETGARGWLVINSLRGGAAGGGTRMRAGVTPREVTYLAKAMELKFALAGPPIGGAKSGIDFDPYDPRKPEVLERWYRTIRPYLREYYGTGGDLGVDEVEDVIPVFRRLELSHPQEGVVRGHLGAGDARFASVLRSLDAGVSAPLTNSRGVHGVRLAVADMITGYGVARSILHYFEHTGRDPEGTRVALQGFGNVGAAAGLYLARAGARIVAVSDAEKTLLAPDGMDAEETEALLKSRKNKLLPGDDPRIVPNGGSHAIWDAPADVFVLAAVSNCLTTEKLARLERAGVDILACGSNQPFAERDIGDTDVQRDADHRFTILPDILANCGMARTFSYLMEAGAVAEAPQIYQAVDHCIDDSLDEVLDRAAGATGLLAATLDLALDRVGAP